MLRGEGVGPGAEGGDGLLDVVFLGGLQADDQGRERPRIVDHGPPEEGMMRQAIPQLRPSPLVAGRADGASDVRGLVEHLRRLRDGPVAEERGQLLQGDQGIVQLPEHRHRVDRLDPDDPLDLARPDRLRQLGDAAHAGRTDQLGVVVADEDELVVAEGFGRRIVLDDGRVVVGEEGLDRLLVLDVTSQRQQDGDQPDDDQERGVAEAGSAVEITAGSSPSGFAFRPHYNRRRPGPARRRGLRCGGPSAKGAPPSAVVPDEV